MIRSLTPPQAAGNALAFAVQNSKHETRFRSFSILDLFRISDFVLRIYNATCHLKLKSSPFCIEFLF